MYLYPFITDSLISLKNKRAPLILGLIISFMVFSTMPCDGERATVTKTIGIKGDCAYPPYEFINEQGKPDGFNVELMQAIMQKLAIPYTLELSNWETVISDFDRNQIDLLTAMMYEESRAVKYHFGACHSMVVPNAICRKNTIIRSLQDLKGKTLILQKEDLCTQLVKKIRFQQSTHYGRQYDDWT